MVTVYKLQDCPKEDIYSIVAKLCKAEERRTLELVLKGAKVQNGEIRGITDIGNLRTRWKQIGLTETANAGPAFSHKLLINEVENALTVPLTDLEEYCERLEILSRINEYRRKLNKADLELNVALLERDGEVFICSGSEKVAALYLFAKEKNLYNTVLPVCVIAPNPPIEGTQG
ncbi:MAG TPA: hypothetical protein VE134_03920 [Methanomicrobiales archaeon]|nr:hypothetical protein [Methanomicrobiales archaeon]